MSESRVARRWFQFRLRTLLLLITLSAVVLAWVGWEYRIRQAEKPFIAWVDEQGGTVNIGEADGTMLDSIERGWWRTQFDAWFGERVWRVVLAGADVDDISPLANFHQLEVLGVANTKVHDLSPLSELSQLHTLSIADTNVPISRLWRS